VRGPKNSTSKIVNVHARPRTASKIELPSTPAASTNFYGIILIIVDRTGQLVAVERNAEQAATKIGEGEVEALRLKEHDRTDYVTFLPCRSSASGSPRPIFTSP
jgi:hypothetical protein